mmetsp:Transcript_44767/g.117414  ORF Transcript_44767/g.117414 Transcript_44767/m.117414 type:complete len:248 (+) Transcript_44767:1461-2204(+)
MHQSGLRHHVSDRTQVDDGQKGRGLRARRLWARQVSARGHGLGLQAARYVRGDRGVPEGKAPRAAPRLGRHDRSVEHQLLRRARQHWLPIASECHRGPRDAERPPVVPCDDYVRSFEGEGAQRFRHRSQPLARRRARLPVSGARRRVAAAGEDGQQLALGGAVDDGRVRLTHARRLRAAKGLFDRLQLRRVRSRVWRDVGQGAAGRPAADARLLPRRHPHRQGLRRGMPRGRQQGSDGQADDRDTRG